MPTMRYQWKPTKKAPWFWAEKRYRSYRKAYKEAFEIQKGFIVKNVQVIKTKRKRRQRR